ncbi:unnamed protein product [Meganyctiphanes norvegica]|uniref:C-type lectin domain-containing protein n=1 Tax=Meganyctiphanes norvegica TaxID=48144 RepID=A0AAV2QUX2_MEGNR
MRNTVKLWGVVLVTLSAAAGAASDIPPELMTEEESDSDISKSITQRSYCTPIMSCSAAGGYCLNPSRTSCNGTVDPEGCLHGKGKKGKRCGCCIPGQEGVPVSVHCYPTMSCTRAGGSCFDPSRSDCNGMVDPRGCRGGESKKGSKCSCCIPEQITSAPTCPVVTCPPPTEAANYRKDHRCGPRFLAPNGHPAICPGRCCSAIGWCGDSVDACYCKGCTDYTTRFILGCEQGKILGPEGDDPSSAEPLQWVAVGSTDRFVRFSKEMNWYYARTLCRRHSLQPYHPGDILAVAQYLEDNFSDRWYWLGAKGNGTHMVWISGEPLTMADPWYTTYYPTSYHQNVGINDCLYVITFNGDASRGAVLATSPCNGKVAPIDVLCG